MKPLITVEEMKSLLDIEGLILLDASFGKNAKEKFEEEHLPGAQFISLNDDLAEIPEDPANGGRHPLPHVKDFNNVLKRTGIHEDSHIIVYDQNNSSMAAARLWWMLKAAGLEKVQVLDGGLDQAKNSGIALTDEKNQPPGNGTYHFEGWQLPKSDMDGVREAVKDEKDLIIDVRSKDRYNGESEPLDMVAGHIPNAVNLPFTENLNEDGTFKDPGSLQDINDPLIKGKNRVIIHCGSGVTACHTILAFAQAGLKIPELYPGSWSEWSSNDNEMVTKKSE